MVKSWLHGWATTHRIKGELMHSCLVGWTNGVDSMSYYLQYPRTFACCRFFCLDVPSCLSSVVVYPSEANRTCVCFHVHPMLTTPFKTKSEAKPMHITRISLTTLDCSSFAWAMGTAAVERSLVQMFFFTYLALACH